MFCNSQVATESLEEPLETAFPKLRNFESIIQQAENKIEGFTGIEHSRLNMFSNNQATAKSL